MQSSAIWKINNFRELAKASSARIIIACHYKYNTNAAKSEKRHQSNSPKNPRPPKTAVSVNVPRKIERSDTDILKALASTIGRDYTAAHYRYHDDPYLIPMSNMAKRSFALSKESGKKAAKWIIQEHADLFNHSVADPPIEAYFPKPTYSAEQDVNQSDLKSCIDNIQLTEAIKVYQILSQNKKEIDKDLKQSLLEFICYYNEAEPLDEEWIEERWYRTGMLARERQKNSWKDNGIAEQIFQELEPQNADMYCALIRGRAKYFQAEKAWQLYKEAESKELCIDVETFNSLIRVVNFLRENSDMRWQLTEEILSDMERAAVKPNLGTMNSVLEMLSTYGNIRQGKQLSVKVIAEFKKLDIEPSLASYYNLLITHCKERGPVSSILVDILDKIEGKTFQIQDPKDTFFFVTAMDVSRNHLQDLDLAVKVDNLLHVGNNYDLIGDSFKESIYYRHFVSLKCNYETFDTFMEFYNKIVPNVYTPEPGIMEEILSSLHLNGAVQYLDQLWSDMVCFDQTNRENLLSLMLQTMAANFPEPTDSDFLHLSRSFTDISWRIWEIIELWDPEKPRTVNWNGKMLGDLLVIQVKADEFGRAEEIMKKLVRSSHDVVGIPNLESLQIFLKNAMLRQNTPMALVCIQYLSDAGFPEVVDLAQEVYSKVEMDSSQISKLSSIVGFDVKANKNLLKTEDASNVQGVSS